MNSMEMALETIVNCAVINDIKGHIETQESCIYDIFSHM